MRRLLLVITATALSIPALAGAGGTQQIATFFTAKTFKASASKVVFKGTLGSLEEKCIKGRKAKLIRKHDGDKKALASDESDSDGKFKLRSRTRRWRASLRPDQAEEAQQRRPLRGVEDGLADDQRELSVSP